MQRIHGYRTGPGLSGFARGDRDALGRQAELVNRAKTKEFLASGLRGQLAPLATQLGRGSWMCRP